jgi:hypothetical protein
MIKHRPEFKGSTSQTERAMALPVTAERQIAHAIARCGTLQFMKTGWPDFLVLDQKGDAVAVLEVKNEGEKPRPDQTAVLNALAKLLPTLVVYVSKDGKVRIEERGK